MSDACQKCGWALPHDVCPEKAHSDHQGSRYNQGKNRVDLIPAIVLIELGKHYTYGANKYQPNNWLKGFPYSETSGSLLRHLYAWLNGEKNDPESGTHHLVAVIWNAVTLFYFELFPEKYAKFDDRVIIEREIGIKPRANTKSVAYKPEFRLDVDTISMAPAPIPLGFAMLRNGDIIAQGDMYLSHSNRWANVLDEDVGTEYNSDRMGVCVIRKYPEATVPEFRSTQIKIPASVPKVPDGYRLLEDHESVSIDDQWFDESVRAWEPVPRTIIFTGRYKKIKERGQQDGQSIYIIRRDTV